MSGMDLLAASTPVDEYEDMFDGSNNNQKQSTKSVRIEKVRGELFRMTPEIRSFLEHRLSYAEDMAACATAIAEREERSRRVSTSSSSLFGTSATFRLSSERKQREDMLNSLDKRCYAILCERAISEVEKLVACQSVSQTWPQVQLPNRYATTKDGDGETETNLGGCMTALTGSR